MVTVKSRQTERLHAGRISACGAIYFVTFVTTNRKRWLGTPGAARAVVNAIGDWHTEGDGAILAATVMPDHVHVLFLLGEKLPVGRCVSRWKASARRASGFVGEWQRDFWERRVREDESIEDYGLYVLLNPYRAGLVAADKVWPWFCLPDMRRFLFPQMLSPEGVPPVEWIGWPDERFAGLATGD